MSEQPVALVTGGNRGIGREICRQLGERGYHVLLSARDPREGIPVARELGLEYTPLDVTDRASIDRLAAMLERRKLALEIVVHNAGVMFHHFDLEVVRNTMAVNFFGVHDLTDAVLPHLAAHARVVILSSGLGDRNQLAPPLRDRFADGALDRPTLVALMQAFV